MASSAEPANVEPRPQPAFVALEVDGAPGPTGSVVIEAREVTMRLDGDIDAPRVAEIASALRGESMNVAETGMRAVVATRPVDFRKGHDKLASVVAHELGLDPYSGVAVVFRPKALRSIAAHQVNLVHLLDLLKGDRVNMARIEAAAEQWSLPGGRRCSQPALAVARQRFVGHAVR